jgi:copper chaperone CopZ
MKMNVLKSAVIVFAMMIAMNANAQKSAKWSEVVIQTNGTCQSCKDKIENGIAYDKGVKDVNYDLATAKVTIKYDAKKTSPETLRTAINKLGFTADGSAPASGTKSCGTTEKKHSSCSGDHDHDGHDQH